MIIGHPSKRHLRAWLLGESNDQLDEHLTDCDRCASIIENMEEPRTDGLIAETLHKILEPPVDLTDRIEVRVAERLDSRQVVGYMAEMFGAGLETSKLLLTDEPD